ncbi:AraC-like DNA-binding protein [Mucilaginibacter oryzae]|uniref:AraC-like DNA-binding protein n=1 Tax=Mucilaginibacter oryzae TaxID=468058 RepID=A0A316H865_9SPHI|nr:helix-turn-helix domain-containing protein [Mucilaginibacter oryzae]PWK76597.1 AraC-like DNA-binding protein [Mucilaginibacter oryzae]
MTTPASTGANKKSTAKQDKGNSFFSVSALKPACYEKRSLEDQQCYTFIFIEKGCCECRASGEALTLDPANMVIFKPRQHLVILAGQDVYGYIFSFSFEFIQAALNSAQMAQKFHSINAVGKITIPEQERAFLNEVVCRLYREYQTDNGLKDAILKALFQVLTLYLNKIRAEKQPVMLNRCIYHINRFFALLDEHFTTLKMPADYANLLAVSPSYLNFIIKENLGFNTSHYIQQRVLAEAKKLMSMQELTMKEVAYNLGFFDVSHFSKFFKRTTGVRFTDFRRGMAA